MSSWRPVSKRWPSFLLYSLLLCSLLIHNKYVIGLVQMDQSCIMNDACARLGGKDCWLNVRCSVIYHFFSRKMLLPEVSEWRWWIKQAATVVKNEWIHLIVRSRWDFAALGTIAVDRQVASGGLAFVRFRTFFRSAFNAERGFPGGDERAVPGSSGQRANLLKTFVAW